MTRAGLLAAAFALATAVAAPAGADSSPTKYGPNIRVSGTAARGHDFGADVATNTTEGHFLVVWEDRLRNGTYGQLVKPDGDRIKWNFRICDQGSPEVAYNSVDNQYLVVTEDLGIYGQLVDADGDRIGSTFEISGFDNGEWGVVAHNPATNHYLVVWRRWGIVGQLVDADGTLIGSNFDIDGPFATGWLAWPDVAANPTNGEFLVVWEDGRQESTRDLDVFGQLVSQDGERLGSNIRIIVRNAQERLPAVTYADATDQYLVVWQDERHPSRGADIYGRILTADGERTGPEFRVSGGNATADDSWPDVAADPDGGRYFVTWMDQRNEATRGRDIFGQLLTASGARVGWNIRASGSKATRTCRCLRTDQRSLPRRLGRLPQPGYPRRRHLRPADRGLVGLQLLDEVDVRLFGVVSRRAAELGPGVVLGALDEGHHAGSITRGVALTPLLVQGVEPQEHLVVRPLGEILDLRRSRGETGIEIGHGAPFAVVTDGATLRRRVGYQEPADQRQFGLAAMSSARHLASPGEAARHLFSSHQVQARQMMATLNTNPTPMRKLS